MSAPAILFVAGDAPVQRAVFERYGCGYWSAGFDTVLEKRGVLDFRKAGPEVLGQPDELLRHRIVIVAWLPPDVWKPAYLRNLWQFDGVVLLEGPLPSYVEKAVGFRRGRGHAGAADVEVVDADLLARLRARHGVAMADGSRFRIAPKAVATKATIEQRWNAGAFDAADFDGTAQALLRAFKVSFLLRLRKGNPFPDVHRNLLMALWLLLYRHKGGELDDDDLAMVRQLVATQPAGIGERVPPGLRDAVELLLGMQPGSAPQAGGTHWLRQLRRVRQGFMIGAELPGLAVAAAARQGGVGGTVPDHFRSAVQRYVYPAKGVLKRQVHTVALHQLAAALLGAGERSGARDLLERVIRSALDPQTGAIRDAIFRPRDAVMSKSAIATPYVPLAWLVYVERVAARRGAMRWQDRFDAGHIERWAAPCVSINAGTTSGASELLRADIAGTPTPVLYRAGRIVVTSFQLLGHLVHQHTMHPLPESFQDSDTTDALLLEQVLFDALDDQVRRYGEQYLRLCPWPAGHHYALTVRHDVDRIPTPEQFDVLLAFETGAGLGVSWYWIHDRLAPEAMARVAAAGHEIALHALSIDTKPAEIAAVAGAAGGAPVTGESLHGGGGEFWLGYPSVAAAVDAGLAYTEGVPTLPDFPYRFPRLGPDGTVDALPVTCISHSYSIDEGVTRKVAHVRNPELLRERIAGGANVIALNHPDINFDALRGFVAQAPAAGRWDATSAAVADWWRRTHWAANLSIVRTGDDCDSLRYAVTAREAVTGLTLDCVGAGGAGRTPAADRTFTIDTMTAGEPRELVIARRRPRRYAELVEHIPPDIRGPRYDPAEILTRAAKYAQVLRAHTPMKDIAGKRVLDVGCAYGAFSLGFHFLEGSGSLLGVDINPAYVQLGNRLAGAAGMPEVRFVEGTFLTLSQVAQGQHDIIIVNNSINYLTTPADYRAAARELAAVTAPGGVLVLLTPNRNFHTEAFTKLVGVQFMPRPFASRYVRLRGRRKHYDDIRLPSSFELVRWLGDAGFRDIRIIDAYNFEERGWRRHFKPRFYLTAVR